MAEPLADAEIVGLLERCPEWSPLMSEGAAERGCILVIGFRTANGRVFTIRQVAEYLHHESTSG